MGENFNTRIQTVTFSTAGNLTSSNIDSYSFVQAMTSNAFSVQPVSISDTYTPYQRIAGVTRSDGLIAAKTGTIVKDGPCKVRVGPGGLTAGWPTTVTASGKLCVWSTGTDATNGHNYVECGLAQVTAVSGAIVDHWLNIQVIGSGAAVAISSL